jgi:tRNA(fMet)-specific endonuclease VapC
MVVLDTDEISLLQVNAAPEARSLADRLRASGRPVWVTVVSLEEQLRGRLAACAAARTPEEYVLAVGRLRATWADYQGRSMLDFDAAAAAEFARLRAAKVRIGTMDLRIAAVVPAHRATLVTRNRRDFEKVPGLRHEDWSRPA